MFDTASNRAFLSSRQAYLHFTLWSAQVGLKVKVCHFIVEEVMIGLVNTAWPGH